MQVMPFLYSHLVFKLFFFVQQITATCHNYRHVKLERKPRICTYCVKGFTQQGDLKKPLTIHTGDKPHAYPQCTRTFTDTSHLTRHMHIRTGEKPLICD